jgi:hypothetical protein
MLSTPDKYILPLAGFKHRRNDVEVALPMATEQMLSSLFDG